MTKPELILSAICNAIILVVTAGIVISYFVVKNEEGKVRGASSLKYFTTLSNVFSAVACGLVLIYEVPELFRNGGEKIYGIYPHALTLLKFYATATVVLTFLTVMFFLGPTQGYKTMLSGTSFHMHFVGPVLAFVSLCLLESSSHDGFYRISVEEMLVGLIPIMAYYYVYLRQVLLVQERGPDGKLIRGWEDFYGFNRNGKWYISGIIMIIAILFIMVFIRVLYNM